MSSVAGGGRFAGCLCRPLVVGWAPKEKDVSTLCFLEFRAGGSEGTSARDLDPFPRYPAPIVVPGVPVAILPAALRAAAQRKDLDSGQRGARLDDDCRCALFWVGPLGNTGYRRATAQGCESAEGKDQWDTRFEGEAQSRPVLLRHDRPHSQLPARAWISRWRYRYSRSASAKNGPKGKRAPSTLPSGG